MPPADAIALRREPGHFVRSLTALLLRGGLGMIFLTAGLQKYNEMNAAPALADPEVEQAIDDAVIAEPEADAELSEAEAPPLDAEPEPRYPESIRGMFAGTWLERELDWALDLFTEALPYVEIGVGALLLVGSFTTLVAFAAGLLLLGLLFGLTVLGNAQMYPNMLTYLLVDAGILWLSPVTSNYLSLDGLFFGWFWRPRAEAHYRINEA